VLSRRSREDAEGIEFATGDLATGEGIEAAVEGAEIIVHCAGSTKGDEDKARHLVEAASRAGPRHLVYISVVGAERIPIASGIDRAMFGYFASKLAAERIVAEAARAFRAGTNLAPERAVGRRTWEEFLAERVGSSSDPGTSAASKAAPA
jgi:nucleoside-diphosphate-sugar epimerase